MPIEQADSIIKLAEPLKRLQIIDEKPLDLRRQATSLSPTKRLSVTAQNTLGGAIKDPHRLNSVDHHSDDLLSDLQE